MEIKVAVKIFEVSMAVHKTWHHRFARDVDHFRVGWDGENLRDPMALNRPFRCVITAFSIGGRPVPSISLPPVFVRTRRAIFSPDGLMLMYE